MAVSAEYNTGPTSQWVLSKHLTRGALQISSTVRGMGHLLRAFSPPLADMLLRYEGLHMKIQQTNIWIY